MFSDVDETLRAILVADLPVTAGEIDISFDRPTREWSSRLTKPTLNLFLYDIRERADMRDQSAVIERTPNGVTKKVPARRIDLSYMVTAWAREPADEHRILARAMASMFRRGKAEPEYLQGALVEANATVFLRIMPPDHHTKPYELWGVLDNELRAAHSWVVTAPLDVFAPVPTPIVRTRETILQDRDGEREEHALQVGGYAHRAGDVLDAVGGVKVSLRGTRFTTLTDGEGRFSFSGVAPGEYVLVAEPAEGPPKEQPVTVPSPAYDVAL